MPTPLKPGFIALHGNRSEDLAQAVIAWLASHPLDPLEQEVVLVQSNGIAEWFKMELARQLGVCGSTRVELPGRFLWRTYRELLGPRAVPRDSPLDKLPMTWRLTGSKLGVSSRLGSTCIRRQVICSLSSGESRGTARGPSSSR